MIMRMILPLLLRRRRRRRMMGVDNLCIYMYVYFYCGWLDRESLIDDVREGQQLCIYK
jgi:hypothetical protein